jgi:hypothetical protein
MRKGSPQKVGREGADEMINVWQFCKDLQQRQILRYPLRAISLTK